MNLDSNYQIINFDEFERKESYSFFSEFDVEHYSITTEICVEGIMDYIKKHNVSFYCIMTYVVLTACNKVDNFCYRRVNNEIRKYNKLAASVTIMKPSNNIDFTNHIYCREDLLEFTSLFDIQRDQAVEGKKYSDLRDSYDLIYITAMPWFRLKSMKNVRKCIKDDTIPRFSWGKMFVNSGETFVDLSIEISHAFIDGYHIHLLVDEIEKTIRELN